ncbi:MAG: SCP2 sterol-binding domain-containing protein [Chloroflexi bacterium]|nr:SCP2 sterol-binding domain-containing protein [Chloroflexota bacterium]
MADKATSIKEVFDEIPERFNPDAAAGVDAVFQFDLSGDNGGKYWVKVADQQVDVNEGEHEDPTLTVLASADDYLAMVNGEIAPMSAFMQGKVKVKGNMGLAMKLQGIFGL